MLTREERRMLRWIAHKYYSGRGSVCDLGCFVGGSTIALADGLKEAGHRGKIIHSFDFYRADPQIWNKYLPRVVRPENGDFFPHVRKLLDKYLDLISFNQGNFLDQPVPEGPIEILFVDISKTLPINDRIISQFFPRLIPGVSIVIQQDYFHPAPLWDIVTMELLQDYFEIIGACDQHSAIFLNTKQVDSSAIERTLSRSLSLDIFRRTIVSAAKRWPETHHKVELFKALKVAEAATEMSEYIWKYPKPPHSQEIDEIELFRSML